MDKRIERELAQLGEGGQRAALVPSQRGGNNGMAVIYYDVPTAGECLGLPKTTEVIVPVPGGYPAGAIDLAWLPSGSPFLGKAVGDVNVHGGMTAEGREWRLVSYHPHNGGGAPPWDSMIYGFHTYFPELVSWLGQLS